MEKESKERETNNFSDVDSVRQDNYPGHINDDDGNEIKDAVYDAHSPSKLAPLEELETTQKLN